MGESSKWKSKLIASSLPLEFEAARILVSRGFAVSADFTYARDASGVVKDFSVDMYATAYPPFSNRNEILAVVELLIECKQRHPNVKWLFLPDPNRPGFSPVTLGRTFRAVDEFSKWFFQPNATVSFDRNSPFCYKGTEIDESSGNVHDSELKHAIAQLQYALPRLLTECVLHNVYGHPEDNRPFLICPILLTTAKLFIARDSLIARDVEKASSLDDIARQVPYLILFSDYGPDFESHCCRECTPLAKLSELESVQVIEAHRLKNGEFEHQLPSNLGTALASGQRSELISYFSKFVVCTTEYFPSLVTRIKRTTTKAVKGLGATSELSRKKPD